MGHFTAKQHQAEFDWRSKIKVLSSVPSSDDSIMDMDVVFVGAGPAGLSGAIRLKQLCQKEFPDIQIAVLEKAGRVGGHSLSGAVVNPVAFKELFPDLKDRPPFRQKVKKEKLFYLSSKQKYPLPLPPTMKNKNFYTASLCEILRWMGEKAEAMDVSLFNSFTADELLVEDGFVRGVSTFPAGLNKDGSRSASFQAPVYIRSKLTVLADGSRGHLSQAWMKWKNISSRYPQTYALGVKEIWSVPEGNIAGREQEIWHTMGHPLPADCFGGAWMYPLAKDLLSIGLVAGLDSPIQNLDVHKKLQELKNHPLFARLLKKGKCLEWGAKTIPEGGWHSIPHQLYDHGLLIAGDAGAMVNVPALKGIHYAITAGMLCAEAAFSALKAKDFSAQMLKVYDDRVRHKSRIGQELYPVRNVRQAFDKNIFWGLLKSGLMFLSKGVFPGDTKRALKTDAEKAKPRQEKAPTLPKAPHRISKTEGVFLSGNKTRDDIPSHLTVKKNLPEEAQKFYESLCPAGVYESKNGKLTVNAPNCVDCKATDVLGPRWTSREGGSGPNYNKM